MLHLLGFLFILIMVLLLIGAGIIGTVVRALFGKRDASARTYSDGPTMQDRPAGTGTTVTGRKKIFDKDEGEYVEFEEIKE
ncbi:MAG: DUF4834 family protein [Bacteroides sp.]|nr:DUF4834 family protein [Bacteroides sp.]